VTSAFLGDSGTTEVISGGRVVMRFSDPAYRNYFAFNAGNPNAIGGANIGLGEWALHDVAAGGGNIAIGDFAMSKQVNLSHSIGIGTDALRNATAASDCIAIGSEALKQMQTGTGTTAVGRLAFSALSEGGNNTGIGDSVGRYSTSAVANCVMGYRSFERGEGDYNVALGYASMFQRGEGNGNTGVGSGSLGGSAGTILGDGNVAIGFNAGQRLGDGDDNVLIGRDAGRDALQKADAVNSIAIGAGTYNDADNQVVIGNQNTQSVLIGGQVFHFGAMTLELTTNSTIKISARGWDGVTRYATITLDAVA